MNEDDGMEVNGMGGVLTRFPCRSMKRFEIGAEIIAQIKHKEC